MSRPFYFLPCLLLVLINSAVIAQKHSLKLGTDIPLQYAIGYDFQVSQKVSVGAKFGLITTPYDEILLGLFELFGANERVIEVIRNGFDKGLVFELGGNYHLKGNHLVGLSGQYVDLRASEARADAIETLLNISFSSLHGPLKNIVPDDIIYLKSSLYQLVFRYGWEKQLKNPRFKIRPEVSLSINLGSNTNIRSDLYDVSEVEDDVNKSLKEFYHRNAYIPTFGLYFVYTFGKQSAN
jgi:hypothetical protein